MRLAGVVAEAAARERSRTKAAVNDCDPHPFGNLARDHGYRVATLSLLLRAPLCARGYVL